jgi:hypothetical protein
MEGSTNGQPAERRRIEDCRERDWLEMYRRHDGMPRYRFVETLSRGHPYEILGALTKLPEDAMPQDNALVFLVPAGHFFAICDNREKLERQPVPARLCPARQSRRTSRVHLFLACARHARLENSAGLSGGRAVGANAESGELTTASG